MYDQPQQQINGRTLNVGSVPPGPMPLDELGKHLDDAASRIDQAVLRVRRTADMLFGEQPETTVDSGSNKPAHGGRLGSLHTQAATIHWLLTRLENELARLSPIVT